MYIIIVGCSRVGVNLALSLENDGHNVVVIDRSRESFQKLGRAFSGITIPGNGFSPDILKEAGIEKADALIAVTDNDNTNIVAVQVAKKMFNIEKTFARIYDQSRAETYRKMGVETVSATQLITDRLQQLIFEK